MAERDEMLLILVTLLQVKLMWTFLTGTACSTYCCMKAWS